MRCNMVQSVPIGGEWFAPMFNLIRNNTMTTTKKASPSFVCFAIGQDEIILADNFRGAQADEAQAFKALATRITNEPKEGGHGVPLSALLPLPKGEKRGNIETAALDFTKRLYMIAMFGNDIAGQIADANVKGETVLALSSITARSGNPYKDQSKRQVNQTYGVGSKYWKDFVARLQESMGQETAKKGREKGVTASDELFIAEHANVMAKRLRKDAEKLDGTIAFDVAPKFAAALLDLCKSYGVDVDKLVK
jgi:hypothetical protein